MKTTLVILAILLAGCATPMPAQVAETSMTQVADTSMAQGANVPPPVPMRPYSMKDFEVFAHVTQMAKDWGCDVTDRIDTTAYYGHVPTWTWKDLENIRVLIVECPGEPNYLVILDN